MPDAKNSQRASKYQAQRAQYADAIAVNPVVNNPRLAELTTWDGPWAGLKVVVIGLGTSGDAAVDVLAQKGPTLPLLMRKIRRKSESASEFTKRPMETWRVYLVRNTWNVCLVSMIKTRMLS